MKTYELEDGKYIIVRNDQGIITEFIRNGKPWIEGMELLEYSKVFHASLNKIDQLMDRVRELEIENDILDNQLAYDRIKDEYDKQTDDLHRSNVQ